MMNKQWYTIGLISVATVSLQAMDDRSNDGGSTDGAQRKAVSSGSPRSQHSGADRAQVPRLRLHSRHGSTGSEGGRASAVCSSRSDRSGHCSATVSPRSGGRASALSGSNGNEDTADDSDGGSGSHRNQVGELIEELIRCSSNPVIAELLLVCIAGGEDLPHDDTADDDGGCSGSHMCPMGELIRCSTDQRRTVEMLVRLAMFGRERSMQRELPHGDAAGDGSQPDEGDHSDVDSSDE